MANTSADSREPVAGLSAASSCIDFLHLGGLPQSFHPVYTHQCFANECIAGWWPPLDAELRSRRIHSAWRGGGDDNGGEPHRSYQFCRRERAEEEARMDIRVLLLPSCESCEVTIQTERFSERHLHQSAPKRPKTVSFEKEAQGEQDVAQKHMQVEEVVKKIALALPPIASVEVNGILHDQLVQSGECKRPCSTLARGKLEGDSEAGYLKQPIGRVLKTYHRTVKGVGIKGEEETKFSITLADGSDPEVAQYHDRVQPLARWFIETADEVDLSEASRGSWKVMYLFRHHTPQAASSAAQSSAVSMVGYVTLLHVASPFRKPRPGVVMRVCQALILPPYQGMGHGSAMLRGVHDYADAARATSNGMEILEVNVEDPAPAFVVLRDRVDYARFSELISGCASAKCGDLDLSYLDEYEVTSEEYFRPASEESLLLVAEELKITRRQALIVHEILKLDRLKRWKQSSEEGSKDKELVEKLDTRYRLMVKRSLRALRLEELGACSSKEEQKAMLGRWFDETFSRYQRIIEKLTKK